MSRVKRARPFLGTMVMHGNVADGNSMFDVTDGNLTVRCSSSFDRGGAPTPPNNFIVTPINEGFGFWNPDGDGKTFVIGTDTQSWSGLSEGTYHLRFEVNDHAPKVLIIDVRVS